MEKRVFVISTRNYPKNENEAWRYVFRQEIDIDNIDGKFRADFCNNQEDYYQGTEVIIKKRSFDGYLVFVVPCLNGNSRKTVRYSFLNNLINTICETESVTSDSVFLIAHDKDLGTNNSLNDVVATDVINKKYDVLRGLRNKKHIFLFQHEPGGELFEIIEKIPLTDDSFSVDSCKNLYGLCVRINSL